MNPISSEAPPTRWGAPRVRGGRGRADSLYALIAKITLFFHGITTPGRHGLPNWKVVLWFPVLTAIFCAVMVALGVSGTSSGAHWVNLGSGDDPRLLAGEPRGIRSDEWLVQQSWVVAQSNNGYSSTSNTFPGGVDMTVLNELPSWDWSSLFRPHLWGYLLFGLQTGIAWHWWLPAFLVVGSCYLFGVTLMPRRPISAALLSVAVFLSPFLLWWYSPSTLTSVAWPLLAMASVVWVLQDGRTWVRWLWAALSGYFAVTLAMGLYVPFIVPGILVFLAFAVGYVLRFGSRRDMSIMKVLGKLVPLVFTGLTAIIIVVAWVWLHREAFSALQSTVYPGARSVPTGSLPTIDPYLSGTFGAVWNKALQYAPGPGPLGGNASEASSVLLLSIFLLPAMAWILLKSLRRSSRVDWLAFSLLFMFAFVGAYLVVPGWDAVAHLVQIDRIPPERFRIIFVVLLPVFVVLVIEHLDKYRLRRAWLMGAVTAIAAAAAIGLQWARLRVSDVAVLPFAAGWKWVALFTVIACFLLFIRRMIPIALASLALAAFSISWGVLPLYQGIFDLSETVVGQTVQDINDAEPGLWIGVGTYETRAILVQSGVETLSGVQNYPSDEMWELIDPFRISEESWNRLGHIDWQFGVGPVVIENPVPDVITVIADPCSGLVQDNIDYVLTDTTVSSECLSPISRVQQGSLTMTVFEVSGARR